MLQLKGHSNVSAVAWIIDKNHSIKHQRTPRRIARQRANWLMLWIIPYWPHKHLISYIDYHRRMCVVSAYSAFRRFLERFQRHQSQSEKEGIPEAQLAVLRTIYVVALHQSKIWEIKFHHGGGIHYCSTIQSTDRSVVQNCGKRVQRAVLEGAEHIWVN